MQKTPIKTKLPSFWAYRIKVGAIWVLLGFFKLKYHMFSNAILIVQPRNRIFCINAFIHSKYNALDILHHILIKCLNVYFYF